MSNSQFEPYAWFLIILSALLLAGWLLKKSIQFGARSVYKNQVPKTACDIDTFVNNNKNNQNPVNAVKVVLAYKLQLGNRTASTYAIPLECVDSPHVEGLRVTRKRNDANPESTATTATTTAAAATTPNTTAAAATAMGVDQLFSESKEMPIVVATIRMGFGHHRLAYSAASWALQTGRPVLFHDLLSIESEEANLIKSTDELYSKFSRMASELGGPVERLWGSAMLSGDANALRIASLTAAHLQPLLLAFPRDTPIITTHQLVALTASAAGFKNVVNLVVDNHPQWFLTVPNTLNIVQGPVNYQSFLKMGVASQELAWAGHWCPADMVNNIEVDCHNRIQRCRKASNSNNNNKPLRLLIPVGGAGAQRKFIVNFVQALSELVKAGKVQLFLNAGDHPHMKTAFLKVLDECGLEFDTVTDTAGVREFQSKLLQNPMSSEPAKAVTLFCFEEYFPAVATTDILARVADVLCCKPSELAFYCVPKLHIRRVGDHEADSAKRSSELGDGTIEARTVEEAMEFLDLFLQSPDLLTSMNQAIINNNKIGIYDGCKNAVKMVLDKK